MTRSTNAIFRADGRAFIREMQRMSNSTDRLDRSVNRNFQRMETRLRKFGRLAGAVFAGFSTVQFVRELGQAAQAYTRIGNTLTAAGINADTFRDKLVATAIESRAEVESLSNALLRLQKIRPNDGADLNLERAATIQRLAVAGGRSSAEASSVNLQLGQALQSGVLQGDELRSLREAAPVELLQAIADQAGITIGELKEAGAQGKLTADLILAAIDSQAEYSRQIIKTLDVTYQQAVTNVRTAFTQISGAVDQELGASSAVASVLQGFADLMVDGSDSARVLATSIQTLGAVALTVAGVRGVGAIAGVIQRNNAAARQAVVVAGQQITATRNQVRADRDRLNQARRNLAAAQREGASQARITRLTRARTVASANLARSLVAERAATDSLAGAQARVSLTARAAAAATSAWNATLSFLGGPIGLVITLGVAFATLASSIKDAGERVTDLQTEMDRLKSAQDTIRRSADALQEPVRELADAEQAVTDALRDQPDAAIAAAKAHRDATRQRLADNKAFIETQIATTADALRRQRREIDTEIISAARSNGLYQAPAGLGANRAARSSAALAGDPEQVSLATQALDAQRQALLAIEDRNDEQQATLVSLQNLLALEQEYQDAKQRQLDLQNSLNVELTDTAANVAEVTAATKAQDDITARIEDRQAKINSLLAERDAIQTQLDDAVSQGDVDRANLLRQELDAVNDALLRQNPIIVGSSAQLQDMAASAVALSDRLDGVTFDGDGELRARAEELRDRLIEAAASGEDVNAVTMQNLQAELDAVIAKADAATDAFIKARGQAAALARQNADRERTLDPRSPNYDPDAARRARVQSNFDDFQNGDPNYRPTRTQTRTSGGSGGSSRSTGSRKEETPEKLREVDQLIKSANASTAARIPILQRLIIARAALISSYPDEKERLQEIDGALERVEEQGRRALGQSIYDELIRGAKAGDTLNDSLKRIGLQLLELAASKALQNINSGLGLLGGGGGGLGLGGGSLLSGIGSLFGFAQGGIMSASGPVSLRSYARGGIASSPQLALFGEGSGPEAYVPLQNGAIPVTVNFPDLGKIGNAATFKQSVRNVSMQFSAPITINGSELTFDEVERRLIPLFRQQSERLLNAVRQANEDDPKYLR